MQDSNPADNHGSDVQLAAMVVAKQALAQVHGAIRS